MIFTQALKITFELNGSTHKCTVDKMYIKGHKPERFYRVGAVSGSRDLIFHEGQWIICSGPFMREELVDAIGTAIEKALDNTI